MRKSAFTIVELLVAVFVLAVLAMLLFPFMSRKRDEARRTSCISNLKQIGLGFKQYERDYDELYPSVAVVPAKRAAATGEPYGWIDSLQPYLKSLQIFQCPSETQQGRQPTTSQQRGYTDYFMNKRMSRVNESKVFNSAVTVLLVDGSDGQDVNDARYAYPNVPSAWKKNPASPLYRHFDGCNYAFADGHVKWLRAEQAPGTALARNKIFTFVWRE